MNFIVELSKLVVLTGEDIWSYLGGQGTNRGVVSIVPPKPDDGSSGVLCPFILRFSVCSGSIRKFSSYLHTHLFFSGILRLQL